MAPALTIANKSIQFPVVSLINVSSSVFIHIAAEIDLRPVFFPNSRKKNQLIRRCKELCKQLQDVSGIINARLFEAILIPPGKGEFIKRRKEQVHIARFDLAILIECESFEFAERILAHPAYDELVRNISTTASFTHKITATNVRRIAPVNYAQGGVFLFNYFFADDVAQNLAVWDYTAGWFQAETGLDNSVLLLPIDPVDSKYTLINHCRWDNLGQVLPSIIFKKTFHTYVLENFSANNVGPMPILYRLA